MSDTLPQKFEVWRLSFLFAPPVMKHLAIFASGRGTNAEAIIEYFKNNPSIKVSLVLTNNPEAGVIKIAHSNKIISAIVSKNALYDEQVMCKLLGALNIEMIALAGFMQLVPDFLIQKFPKRIINIHPALLPKYGGKGMYGPKVHEAVVANKETETGISIHYVNERYDEGEIILQKKIAVSPGDTAEEVAVKVKQLEHEWYPKALETLLS
jgi:phosphoribosylglycinamide formyltransferase-1